MRRPLFAAALLVAGLAGCSSSARFIERDATGGVVAVPDERHQQDGEALIRKEVGRDFTVVEAHEVPTGATFTRSKQEQGTGSVFARMGAWFTGHRQTQTSETTTGGVTEWRMTYTLNKVPGASPGVVPAQFQPPPPGP